MSHFYDKAIVNLSAIHLARALKQSNRASLIKAITYTTPIGPADKALFFSTERALDRTSGIGYSSQRRFRAIIALVNGNAEMAIGFLGDIAPTRNSAIADLLLAEAYFRKGDYAIAGRIWQRSGSMQPFVSYAQRHLKDNGFEDAEQLLRRAVLADPSDEQALRWLVSALFRLDRIDAALASAEDGLRVVPHSARLYSLFGDLVIAKGDVERARAAYHRSLELDSQDYYPMRGLGSIALWYDRDPKRARDLFLAAISLAPTDSGLHVAVAEAYLQEGKFEQSAAWSTQALGFDPGNRWAFLRLAQAAYRLGEFNRAKACAQQALDIDTSLSEARTLLAAVDKQKSNITSSVCIIEGTF